MDRGSIVDTDVLSEGQINNLFRREHLSGLYHDLSDHPVALDVLVEGVVGQLDAYLAAIGIDDLVSRQTLLIVVYPRSSSSLRRTSAISCTLSLSSALMYLRGPVGY